jgi:hypothetical protein
VKIDKTQLAPGDSCGGSTQKATAIEIGHLGHPHALFADSVLKTLAARKLRIGHELGFATFSLRRSPATKPAASTGPF